MKRRLWGYLAVVLGLLAVRQLSTPEADAPRTNEVSHNDTAATNETARSARGAAPTAADAQQLSEARAIADEVPHPPATAHTPASPRPMAPKPSDAPHDPRAHARWGKPAQCSADGPVLQARRALLANFRIDHASGVDALVAPGVPVETFLAIADLLRQVTYDTATLAQLPISTPPLVLYASLDDLRSHACVHPAAIAYYDGALHVSSDTDAQTLRENLQHEIVHHALMMRGVRAPMWLHEGLAMFNAREIWWAERRYGLLAWGLRYHHPFARMVDALPHTQSEPAALAVYFQSIMMVQTVIDNSDYGQIWRLVEALSRGNVAPAEAFAWGVQTSDLAQQDALWRETVRKMTLAAVGPGYTVD